MSQFKTLDDVYNQTSGQYSTHKTTARVIEHRNGTLCEAATYRVGLSWQGTYSLRGSGAFLFSHPPITFYTKHSRCTNRRCIFFCPLWSLYVSRSIFLGQGQNVQIDLNVTKDEVISRFYVPLPMCVCSQGFWEMLKVLRNAQDSEKCSRWTKLNWLRMTYRTYFNNKSLDESPLQGIIYDIEGWLFDYNTCLHLMTHTHT